MGEEIVPMIHVPDVTATAQWYESIGFTIVDTFRECDEGEVNWALLRLGDSTIMLNAGGKPSNAPRREFDLYIHVDDIDSARRRLDAKASIVEDLHDTFYGMREFIVRDCNGFWITFGQRLQTQHLPTQDSSSS
jgi:uncharacterized glyoxalase superfamily protein PhnB